MSIYLRVLRHPDFGYLFAGQSASEIGDQLVIVALALFVTQRTGSAGDLGLILSARSIPLVALVLLGGIWADRVERRRIMIAADWTRAALHGLLAALILAGAVQVWEIAAIEAAFEVAQAFFQPAYTGLLPQTVPEDLIQDASAMTLSAANLASVAGPALGTALVLGVGAGEAFALDALTFVASAVLVATVRGRARGDAAPVEAVLAALRSGWREVRSRTWVWVTIAAFTGAVFCVYVPWYALAPGIARSVYGGVGVFGLLEVILGVGAVCGGLLGLAWRPTRPLRAGLLLVLVWPVQTASFALRRAARADGSADLWQRGWLGAAHDLVGHSSGALDSSPGAFARERLGLDGLTCADAGGLSGRWAALGPRRPAPRARRRERAGIRPAQRGAAPALDTIAR